MTEAQNNKFYPVSWDELHRNAKLLAWRLLDLGPWKGILAITRGGMVPAAIVARELDIRVVDTVCVVGYDYDDSNPQMSEEAKILKSPIADLGDGEGWLIVDDLVDTGRTAALLRQIYPKAHVATIYAKAMGRPMVDTFVTEVSQDTWIYFPWDIELQFTQPLAVQKKKGSLT